MDRATRRRGVLEMAICGLLVAALAVQPAAGEPPEGKPPAHAAAVGQAGPSTPAAASSPSQATVDSPGQGGAPPGLQNTDPPGQAKKESPTSGSSPGNSSSGGSSTSSREPAPPSSARAQQVTSRASVSTPAAQTPATPAAAPVAAQTPQPAAGAGAPSRGGSVQRTPRSTPADRDTPARAGAERARTAAPSATRGLGAPLVSATTATALGVRAEGPASAAEVPTTGAKDVLTLTPPRSRLVEFVDSVPRWIWLLLTALGVLVALLVANAILQATRTRRLERQRERLMEDIGLLQAALLPAVPPRLGALLTTVAYRPADGPAGGDFYDAFALPDGRVGLLLGDVSGHGRQALAKTTLVRFTVRAHLEAGLSPRAALAISGRALDGRLADDFATVIAAIHDPVRGTLTYASAGHPPPLVVGPPAHRPVTASSAPPLGAGFPTGQRQTVLPMPEGTTVCLYSDGLLEARVDGVALGRERLEAWLAELGPDATAQDMVDRVVIAADALPDDLAACLLHASPGASAPAARIEQLKLDVLDTDGPDLEGFLRACGVQKLDRILVARRVSEQLATAGGVIVEVRTGTHPVVSVAPIGDEAAVVVARAGEGGA